MHSVRKAPTIGRLLIFSLVFVCFSVDPKDYYTGVMEVSPMVIGFMILVFTYKSVRLISLVYLLVLVHCVELMVSGHYT